jgi:hypothetical protein
VGHTTPSVLVLWVCVCVWASVAPRFGCVCSCGFHTGPTTAMTSNGLSMVPRRARQRRPGQQPGSRCPALSDKCDCYDSSLSAAAMFLEDLPMRCRIRGHGQTCRSKRAAVTAAQLRLYVVTWGRACGQSSHAASCIQFGPSPCALWVGMCPGSTCITGHACFWSLPPS